MYCFSVFLFTLQLANPLLSTFYEPALEKISPVACYEALAPQSSWSLNHFESRWAFINLESCSALDNYQSRWALDASESRWAIKNHESRLAFDRFWAFNDNQTSSSIHKATPLHKLSIPYLIGDYAATSEIYKGTWRRLFSAQGNWYLAHPVTHYSRTATLVHLRMSQNLMRKHDFSRRLLVHRYLSLKWVPVPSHFPSSAFFVYYALQTDLSLNKIGISRTAQLFPKSLLRVFRIVKMAQLFSNPALLPFRILDLVNFKTARPFQNASHTLHILETPNEKQVKRSCLGGGPAQRHLSYDQLKPYALLPHTPPPDVNSLYSLAHHISKESATVMIRQDRVLVGCRMPLFHVLHMLNLAQAKSIAQSHSIPISLTRTSLSSLREAIRDHKCHELCDDKVFLFHPATTSQARKSVLNKKAYYNNKAASAQLRNGSKADYHLPTNDINSAELLTESRPPVTVKNPSATFPPQPPSQELLENIIRNFCNATSPERFTEAGCAVCGQLRSINDLNLLSNVKINLEPLVVPGVMRKERLQVNEAIQEIEAPVMDEDCRHVCLDCSSYLKKIKCLQFLWLTACG